MEGRRPSHLGFGAGLRTDHFDVILGQWPVVDWFEAISENFMIPGGRPLSVLDQIRDRYPVALHGVSLSIGSVDPVDLDYLSKLKDLIARVEPPIVSDHLCWTRVGGRNSHDLLPLPFTEEALSHVVERVREVQDFLGRRIALENVSSYLEFSNSSIPEAQFLAAVAERADCGILLDVNNLFVNAFNHGFSTDEYLATIDPTRVVQFHLAGHTDRGAFLHDTHDHPVAPAVWDLFRRTVDVIGTRPTLIEWDDRIPPFATIQAEVEMARHLSASHADASIPVGTLADGTR